MKRELEISLIPEEADDVSRQKQVLAGMLSIETSRITFFRILRRSIDARSKNVKIRLLTEIYWDEPAPRAPGYEFHYQQVHGKKQAIIVGAGPAGLFAALRMLELGIKPIILERGKDVQARRRDLAAINKQNIVNPDSNYCFGEGGAGTYSDGKLYTRASKRGDIKRILHLLVKYGAKENILIEAHPHIGTNKLPKIIAAIRESIIEFGGEVHFNTKVTDFILKDGYCKGVIAGNKEYAAEAVILATGHSARDIFELLSSKGISVEAKPFALGVRIEHPQDIIDRIQYHCDVRPELLPAASYSLVEQIKGRGVYSFCMCPGGFIVPSATSQEEIVVNGMSPSKRDSRFANSGIVVAITAEDFASQPGNKNLSALHFQQAIEHKAWKIAGGTQAAPAQRMVDFVNNKVSGDLPETSYQPGIVSVSMSEILPKFIGEGLKEAFKAFGQKMKGYLSNEAVLVGVESRTSSPVRIPRDTETGEHIQIKGLFPCGEGAGYAGGIVSAAMDGTFSAEKSAAFLLK